MIMDELSPGQNELATAPAGFFATACPGAGKTRAVVTRFLKRTAEEPRRGIALVSFSTAAVKEMQQRCSDRADALGAPHFVGTFDAFLHRFVITPLYTGQYRRHPQYVRSWKDIDDARFRLRTLTSSPDLELDWFDFNAHGQATLDMRRISRSFGAEARSKLSMLQAEAEARATKLFDELLKAGIVSSEAARWLARRWFAASKPRSILKQLLSNRFSEIIVDEAQDCGEEELTVLRFLRSCGLGIVMVGDLDQSIYEFRTAAPDRIRDFAASLHSLHLMDNWRSTPAICAFNSSLRAGRQAETARGKHAASTVVVQLVEYTSPKSIAPAAHAVAREHRLAADDLMFLSHAETTATVAAGGIGSAPTASKVYIIAAAGITLRSAASTEQARHNAIEKVERTVIAALSSNMPSPRRGIEATCRSLGLSRRWLREIAVRMAVTLKPGGRTAQQFAAAVRNYFQTVPWGDVTPPEPKKLSSLFKAPPQEAWAAFADTSDTPQNLHSTVHGVKGREFRGVVVVLPRNLREDNSTERTVLDDWEGDYDTEPRRVLYVAGSRAQELLILAVHRTHLPRIEKLLASAGVPHCRA